MIQTYDADSLLALYSALKHHEGGSPECTVTLAPATGTAVGLREMLLAEMDAWYVNMLDSAPAEMLPVTDMADSCVAARTPSGAARLTLPEGARRLVSVTLPGWHTPATVINDPSSPEARRQLNPYACGSAQAPVAVALDSRRRVYDLYTPLPGDGPVRPEQLLCVPEPDGKTYHLDPSVLSNES